MENFYFVYSHITQYRTCNTPRFPIWDIPFLSLLFIFIFTEKYQLENTTLKFPKKTEKRKKKKESKQKKKFSSKQRRDEDIYQFI